MVWVFDPRNGQMVAWIRNHFRKNGYFVRRRPGAEWAGELMI